MERGRVGGAGCRGWGVPQGPGAELVRCARGDLPRDGRARCCCCAAATPPRSAARGVVPSVPFTSLRGALRCARRAALRASKRVKRWSRRLPSCIKYKVAVMLGG